MNAVRFSIFCSGGIRVVGYVNVVLGESFEMKVHWSRAPSRLPVYPFKLKKNNITVEGLKILLQFGWGTGQVPEKSKYPVEMLRD